MVLEGSDHAMLSLFMEDEEEKKFYHISIINDGERPMNGKEL